MLLWGQSRRFACAAKLFVTPLHPQHDDLQLQQIQPIERLTRADNGILKQTLRSRALELEGRGRSSLLPTQRLLTQKVSAMPVSMNLVAIAIVIVLRLFSL